MNRRITAFKRRRRFRGFTLIELLVVISIIGLLASIVLASLSTARAKGRDVARIETGRTLATALELYRSNNSDRYPVTGTAGIDIETGLVPQLIATGAISRLTAGFSVPGKTDVYVSDGNLYELLFALESGSSGKNTGCFGADLTTAFPGSASGGCFGNNVTASLYTPVGSGGGGPPPPSTYTLTVAKSGAGSATITSSPSGIDCGPTCSYSYASATYLTITAYPDFGTAVTWSGCQGSAGNDCIQTLYANTTVTANMTTGLSVSGVNGGGQGYGGGTVYLYWSVVGARSCEVLQDDSGLFSGQPIDASGFATVNYIWPNPPAGPYGITVRCWTNDDLTGQSAQSSGEIELDP